MVRKIIIIILALLILFGAYLIASKMAASRSIPKPVESTLVTPVTIIEVTNGTAPITLKTSGNIVAKNHVEIFSEVMGVFEKSDRAFKPGTRFAKGDVLMRINSDELRANIRAQKSGLINQVTLLLPDLKLDYPEAFAKWNKYVSDFDLTQPLATLPETTSEREKLFIIGRGLQSTYYNIENLETRLAKYVIRAPFSGVLTDVAINPGAVVRNGQKLAGFISTAVYEMEVNINVSYLDLLRVGKKVQLHNLERTNSWTGRVARINGVVDQSTQTIKVYIDVSGKGLREGLYLEADLEVNNLENIFEIDRKLLYDDNKLFVVRDSFLASIEVNPVFYNESTVVVEGLPDGTKVLSRIIPGAHEGMRVSIDEL